MWFLMWVSTWRLCAVFASKLQLYVIAESWALYKITPNKWSYNWRHWHQFWCLHSLTDMSPKPQLQGVPKIAPALGEASQLWALMSQAFLGKNTKFLCSLDWKFPRIFKTHQISSWMWKAYWSLQTLITLFVGHPVSEEMLRGEVMSVC